jgi:hypothetical protein
MAMDLLKQLGQFREIGDALQTNFKGDWLLKTAASACKKFIFEALERDVEIPYIKETLNLPDEETAARVVHGVFDALRRKY